MLQKKSMSGVDKDEEPAYRLYFYSVCILFTFLICICVSPDKRDLTHFPRCLHVGELSCQKGNLTLALLVQSRELALSLWCAGKDCRGQRINQKSGSTMHLAFLLCGPAGRFFTDG